MRVPLSKGSLRFEIKAPHADVAEKPVKAQLVLNGITVAGYMLGDNEWRSVVLDPSELPQKALPDFDAGFLGGLTGILEVTVDRVFIPAQHSDIADDRSLGIGVTKVGIMP
jgi:hypothetical protein